MPLENPEVIDIILKPVQNKLKLVITDAGVTTDCEERMNLFVAKLRTYVAYITSEEFRAEYPSIRPNDVTICLVTRNPPTEQMSAITHVTPTGDKDNRIAVQFEMFGGSDGLMNSDNREPPPDARKQRRPWWKFWS